MIKDVLRPNPSCLGVSTHLTARILPVRLWPDSILSEACSIVTEFDNDTLGQLVMDMVYTMDSRNGVGLAAPQVGVLKNIIVISVPKYYLLDSGGATSDPEYSEEFISHLVMINPKIVEVIGDKKVKIEEGCLSVPGYFEYRNRFNTINVEYTTPRGNKQSVQFNGMESFVVQHEIDHLNGKLFIDGLSKLKKDRIKKKIIKTQKM